jgi:hypothetical protein
LRRFHRYSWRSIVTREIEKEILPYAQAGTIGSIVYSPMSAGLPAGSMTKERVAKLTKQGWRKNFLTSRSACFRATVEDGHEFFSPKTGSNTGIVVERNGARRRLAESLGRGNRVSVPDSNTIYKTPMLGKRFLQSVETQSWSGLPSRSQVAGR